MPNIFLILLLLVAASTPTVTAAEKVKMAVFKLEPFMMTSDTEEATGVTVEYWKHHLAPEMGIELEVLGVFPLKRAIRMLQHGQVDTVSQLTRIPEREALFLYPEIPLTHITPCLIIRNDSPIKQITSQQDLFGLNIGFIEAGYIPPLLLHERIHIDKVVALDFRDLNHRKLIGKRVDALLDINCLSARYFYKRTGYNVDVRFVELPSEPVGVNAIFRRTAKGETLRNAFEKAHRKLAKKKVFEEISEQYLE